MTGRRFGPELTPSGTTFRLWAPAAKSVELVTDRPVPMESGAGGWRTLAVPGAGAGTFYKFRVDGMAVSDPASAFQPEDVNGPSEMLVRNAYTWRATDWRGWPWAETVVLELHGGT